MQSKQLWLPILAACAVWKLSGRDSKVVSVLSQAMQWSDETDCVLAAQALGEMVAAAKTNRARAAERADQPSLRPPLRQRGVEED